ncbi:lycopene cyclase domain-containing protein [Candidatus Micrarchaeota archaeon]|nr:lycopene cyclase domain-containing protein [Candidatus Micrarchaeota archaeon]
MTEYTVAAVFMFVLGIGANFAWNPMVRKNPEALLAALGWAALAQLVFDNLTVARGFWHFNDAAVSGIRIPFMPVENLFFGMALFLFTVLAWELAATKTGKAFKSGFRA